MTQTSRQTGRLGVKPLEAHDGTQFRSSIARSIDNSVGAPPPRAEFIRLLHAVSALNAHDRSFVLQFVSSTGGEGTSTVAMNFVKAASFGGRRSVVLVDCSGNTAQGLPSVGTNHPTLIGALQSGRPLETAIRPFPGKGGVMIGRLAHSPNPLLVIDTVTLQHLLDVLKQTYSVIVLDCPAADRSSDSLAMARHCDGTVLVVRAEVTPRSLVTETKIAIDRFGGQLIGVVLNRSRLSVPNWLKWAI